MESGVEDRVISFTREMQANLDETVNLQTRLQADLEMHGDDAIEYFSELATEFRVEVEGIEFDRYFEDETWLGRWWILRTRGKRERQQITVGHIVDVVKAGRWFDPA